MGARSSSSNHSGASKRCWCCPYPHLGSLATWRALCDTYSAKSTVAEVGRSRVAAGIGVHDECEQVHNRSKEFTTNPNLSCVDVVYHPTFYKLVGWKDHERSHIVHTSAPPSPHMGHPRCKLAAGSCNGGCHGSTYQFVLQQHVYRFCTRVVNFHELA